jgi:UDPglucose 6-dehydrogenase
VIEGVEYALSAYGCLDGADAMVLVTEWDMSRAYDIATIEQLLKQPIVVDLRNV